MTFPIPSVADNVRAEMVRRRLRQVELAAALDLSRTAINRRLAGEMEFSASELQKLAGHLGVSVGVLLGEVSA